MCERSNVKVKTKSIKMEEKACGVGIGDDDVLLCFMLSEPLSRYYVLSLQATSSKSSGYLVYFVSQQRCKRCTYYQLTRSFHTHTLHNFHCLRLILSSLNVDYSPKSRTATHVISTLHQDEHLQSQQASAWETQTDFRTPPS